jgi:ABC-type phosphate transport system permease subunit
MMEQISTPTTNQIDRVKALLQFVQTGLAIVTLRLLTNISLGMTFALYCWAMYEPNVIRGVIATVFTLLAFIPCIIHEHKG